MSCVYFPNTIIQRNDAIKVYFPELTINTSNPAHRNCRTSCTGTVDVTIKGSVLHGKDVICIGCTCS